MNINPDKIKELMLIYSELDEEYQERLFQEAYKLQLMRSQKKQMQKEDTIYKTEAEFQKELESRTGERAAKILEVSDIFDKANDTDKAALFMMVNYLARRKNSVCEPDIFIEINQKEISMQEYLEKYLMSADYDKARDIVIKTLNEDSSHA